VNKYFASFFFYLKGNYLSDAGEIKITTVFINCHGLKAVVIESEADWALAQMQGHFKHEHLRADWFSRNHCVVSLKQETLRRLPNQRTFL